ncbi:MAG: Tellurium resistance [Gordonia sp.]|uniref:Tellurium resistance n=1 Tax=Gordonia rubripertincta TaxID=36822 RepID=A0ABT4N098_GORRU|nr:Tellurium resistance [Gordonia rubripertincta]MBA4022168.1 Tellurium resistance [Gordonia sp. (in: high G+C Gram-positive bacteria)]MCZ4552672.1 Tellurium resistance [Gordonia rubripertincta]
MAIDYTKRPRSNPTPQTPAPAAPPTAPAPPPAASAVDLSKISLTKSSPTVSLAKAGVSGGTIRINLNWAQGSGQGGGFFKRKSGVDLDLRCLFELSDGSLGGVGALDRNFGSLEKRPFIKLDQDDRSGSTASGENMFVNLADPGVFRRILVFADIYEGSPNWAAVDGVVTVESQFGPPIEVRMDSPKNNLRTASIALIESGPHGVTITRAVEYFSGGDKMDKHFRWGLNWGRGSK